MSRPSCVLKGRAAWPETRSEGFTLLTSLTRNWLAVPLAALALLPLPVTAHAQGTPPPGRASASAESDLSPAQSARADARQAQFRKDTAALMADTKMNDTQKRARYAALARSMDKDMLAILTPAQRTQVMSQRQIGVQFQKDIAALKADKTLTDAQKQARYEALRQAANRKALATLTPVQRARAEKQQQEGQARQAEVTRMGKELQASLSPAQDKQIHAIGLASGTQVQAVIADRSVPEQAKIAKIATLRQQAQAKINAVLTASQRALYARIQSLVTAPLPQ